MNIDFDIKCIKSDPQAGICDSALTNGGSGTSIFIPDIGAPVFPIGGVVIVPGISGLRTENAGLNVLQFNNLRDLSDYVVDPNGTSQFTTLDAAILSANVDPRPEAINIILWPGTYVLAGPTTITRPNIWITSLGDGRNSTATFAIISGTIIVDVPTGGATSNVSFKGIQIDGGAATALNIISGNVGGEDSEFRNSSAVLPAITWSGVGVTPCTLTMEYCVVTNSGGGPAGSFTGTSTAFSLTMRATTIVAGSFDNPGGGGSVLVIMLDSNFQAGGISITTGNFDISRLNTEPNASPISLGTGTIIIKYSYLQSPLALTSGNLIMSSCTMLDNSMTIDTSFTFGSLATPNTGACIILHSFLGGTTNIDASATMVALFDTIALGIASLNVSGVNGNLSIENSFLNISGGTTPTPLNWTMVQGAPPRAMVVIFNSSIIVTSGDLSVPLIVFTSVDARLNALNSTLNTSVSVPGNDLLRIDSRTPDIHSFSNCNFRGSIDITSSAGMTTNVRFANCTLSNTKLSDTDVILDIHSGATVLLDNSTINLNRAGFNDLYVTNNGPVGVGTLSRAGLSFTVLGSNGEGASGAGMIYASPNTPTPVALPGTGVQATNVAVILIPIVTTTSRISFHKTTFTGAVPFQPTLVAITPGVSVAIGSTDPTGTDTDSVVAWVTDQTY